MANVIGIARATEMERSVLCEVCSGYGWNPKYNFQWHEEIDINDVIRIPCGSCLGEGWVPNPAFVVLVQQGILSMSPESVRHRENRKRRREGKPKLDSGKGFRKYSQFQEQKEAS